MKRVLYISYDGMTDPLGQSQVINYLIGLRKEGYDFDILSFEKQDKLLKYGAYIRDLLNKHEIRWYPKKFHHSPPVLSKIYDKLLLLQAAKKLHRKNNYAFIHCRSYPAAEVALKIQKHTGVKFLFDMRGFWPDEKAEGGHWDRNKFLWRKVYQFYKKKEKEFIVAAAHIISLTRSAKKEIESRDYYSGVPVTVIPCCADNGIFLLKDENKTKYAKDLLKIPAEKFVLSYLGSLGTWYMIKDMLVFFAELKKKKPDSVFLIITSSDHEIIIKELAGLGLSEEDVKIISVAFKDVAMYMYASDVSISFIMPVYSKSASSPVKIGEILSMGIPVIANNIGDSGLFIQENNLGIMLNDTSEKEIERAVKNIDVINDISPAFIRKKALEEYSLAKGVQLYKGVYQQILQP